MKIAALKERTPGELRVAASPDSVKKFIALGATVFVEAGAGAGSSFRDEDYRSAGATVVDSVPECCRGADIILKVGQPDDDEIFAFPKNAILIGMLDPINHPITIKQYAEHHVSSFSMEFLPRISRAQSMDVLSSQSNLAGYRAVIDAVAEFGKAVPMMMTAAGTVAPAKILVLGAGVAGLQAIATAKRLGGVVSAFDVRPAVKEQVESLGAKFVEVKADDAASAETAGGYAKEMSDDYKRKQSELIHETLKKQDIVITTALIPNRPAPVLITPEMVKDMKEGAVIIDLAVNSGGNCPLSKPDETVISNGVKIIGYSNMPSRIAVDASNLYARNLYNFVAALMVKDKQLAVQWDDELIKGTLITRDGKIVHPQLAKE